MTTTTPRGLWRVITHTLETVTSVFRAHGLNINFKQGETEMCVNFQGSSRNKSKFRAEIQEHLNTFPHVVSQYKHLDRSLITITVATLTHLLESTPLFSGILSFQLMSD